MKNTLTWRWRGTKLKKIYSDDYPKKGDFELPDFTSYNEIHKIEEFGPGFKSWVYIKWLLFFKYR